MRSFYGKDMIQLHDRLAEGLILGTPDELDVISAVDTHQHMVVAEAESMNWDFDLKSSWLTKQRWSMLVRQYIDPIELEQWIGKITAKIGTKNRGIAVLRTRVVKPRGGEATGHTNKESRSWGSCMLTFSYKALPQPHITMHSRTSYLGYLGALDMSVGWMVAKYLAKELGIPVETMSFTWVNEATQWHYFKSLSYMLSNPDEEKREHYTRLLTLPSADLTRAEKRMILDHPSILGSRKWLRKSIQADEAGRTYGDMTYNTFRRVIRRFHTETYGYEYAQQFEGWQYYKKGPQKGEQQSFQKAYAPLPSLLVSTLDLSAIGMPANRRYGEPFAGVEDGDVEGDDE